MTTKRMGVLCCCMCVGVLAVLAACQTQSTGTPQDLERAGISGSDDVGNIAVSEENTALLKQAPVVLPDGMVRLRGQVVGGGAPCVQFRTDDGEQISLEGASPQDFSMGARFELTGHFVAISRCMQGAGFAITDHERLTQ